MVNSAEKSNTGQASKGVVTMVTVVLSVLLVVAIAGAIFFWNESRDAKSQTIDGVTQRNQEESDRVIRALDDILLTESDSQPTVARVEDASALMQANPEFYKNVQEGDFLVLYPQRAVVYRDSESKIINVAPIIDTNVLGDDANSNTNEAEDNQAN